jgi:hypothetical protein
MTTIWCVRKEHPSIERRDNRFRALARAFSRADFRIWSRNDVRGLRGRPDVLIVYGSVASAEVRQWGLRGRFNVYNPSYDWSKGRKAQELQEIRAGSYDLVVADVSYWLDDIRRIHKHVHYIDMGFDPDVFKPDGRIARTTWDVAFVGNTKAFNRKRQIGIFRRDLSHRKMIFKTGADHKEYARILQQSRIGWNQVGPLGSRLGVNYRVWEVLGSAALLLVNPTTDLEVILKDRVNVVFWHNTKEMTGLAEHYLRHWDDEGKKIAKAGCKLARHKFTWDCRARELKQLIERYYKG